MWTPSSLTKGSPDLYVGYFENQFGEQWIFTFDRTTREAQLRGGDVDWATVHVVRDSRVDGLILGREEAAWLQMCWKAATACTPSSRLCPRRPHPGLGVTL